MTKAEYEQLYIRAEELILQVRAFPAIEMMAYEDRNRQTAQDNLGLMMWSLYLETQPY